MSGGGSSGGSSTTVQKTEPWSGVKDYLTTGYNSLANLYGDVQRNNKGTLTQFNFDPSQGPQYYPGQSIVNPSGWEGWGQDLQKNWALGNALPMAQGAQGGINNLLGASGATQGMLPYAANAVNEMQGAGKSMQDTGFGQANTAYNQLMGGGDYMQRAGVGNYMQGAGALGNTAGALVGRGEVIQDKGFNWGAMPAMQQLLAAGDPSSNPYFQQAVQSAIRPVTQQFQEQVMPGIKSGAIGAGQMGSSRQGVAEGIASRGYMDTVGDITANMGNSAYAQGLQAMQAAGGLGSQLAGLGGSQIGQGAGLQGQLAGLGSQFAGQGLGAMGQAGQLGQNMLGTGVGAIGASGSLAGDLYGTGMESAARGAALAPGVQQMGFLPGQTIEGIGQQLTADQQAQTDADMARWNYQQNLPFMMMSDYLGMLNGAQGGQTYGSMQSPQTGSMLGRAGGGALAGYGMTGSPYGALAGGLLGLF